MMGAPSRTQHQSPSAHAGTAALGSNPRGPERELANGGESARPRRSIPYSRRTAIHRGCVKTPNVVVTDGALGDLVWVALSRARTGDNRVCFPIAWMTM